MQYRPKQILIGWERKGQQCGRRAVSPTLDLDRLGHRFADVAHGGSSLGGFEGRVRAVGPGDGQLAVVVWDVGVGSWFGCGVHTTCQLVLLLLFLLL